LLELSDYQGLQWGVLSTQTAVSHNWIVTPCSIVVAYKRFGVPCCLHR